MKYYFLIKENGGEMSTNDMAKAMGVRSETVTNAMNILIEKYGAVERVARGYYKIVK